MNINKKYKLHPLDTEEVFYISTDEELVNYAEEDRKNTGEIWEWNEPILNIYKAFQYLDTRDIEVTIQQERGL